MTPRKKVPSGTVDDPRISWRKIIGSRYYQGVLRVGSKIIWVCTHVHYSPNGYGTTIKVDSQIIKWSALDCAAQEKAKRADQKAVASIEIAGGA